MLGCEASFKLPFKREGRFVGESVGDSAAKAKAEKCPGEGRWGRAVITRVAWRCHRSWVTVPVTSVQLWSKSCLQEELGLHAEMQEWMNPWRWQNPGCKVAPSEFPHDGFKALRFLKNTIVRFLGPNSPLGWDAVAPHLLLGGSGAGGALALHGQLLQPQHVPIIPTALQQIVTMEKEIMEYRR